MRQSSLPLNTEIVFVDNSSDEKPILRENKKTSDSYGCVYVREPIAGVSRARNEGIRNSTKKYIVLVDDDFLFDKMWIMNLLKNFEKDRAVSCCTGRVKSYRNDKSSRLFEQFMSFDKGCFRKEFDSKDISVRKIMSIALKAILKIRNKKIEDRPAPYVAGTAYCSIKRELLDEIGFFNETLGPGTPARGGEDLDFLYRILKSGHNIVYDPRSIVFHVHRSTISEVYRKSYNYGIGVRSWMSKYLRNDAYILTCFIGTFFYLVISFIRFSLKKNSELRTLIFYQLLGFVRGPHKSYRLFQSSAK